MTRAGLRIDREFQALIPALSLEERATLEANIRKDGCRDPLVVWKGLLLDGHNRYAICTEHRIPYRTVDQLCADRDDAKIWIIRNQFGRRNLAAFARAELALQLEPLEAAKARVRQGTRTDKGRNLPENSPESPRERETRTKVAQAAGVSENTIAKAKVITERASEPIKEKLRRGDTTIHKEYKAIVQAERKAVQIAKVEAVGDLPEGPFHVIAVDPPWAYTKRAKDSTHRGASPYPSMTDTEIGAMPVGARAADDCVLWLWTTNAFMLEAHVIARNWGFEVKTILTWAKDRMGTGDWLRGQTEHCLMAVRGRPVVTLTNQTTLLHGTVREHSRKPEEFYALVEALCVGRKCELFSRTARDGWASFGAEWDQFPRSA